MDRRVFTRHRDTAQHQSIRLDRDLQIRGHRHGRSFFQRHQPGNGIEINGHLYGPPVLRKCFLKLFRQRPFFGGPGRCSPSVHQIERAGNGSRRRQGVELAPLRGQLSNFSEQSRH
jgi:hypothetical protein